MTTTSTQRRIPTAPIPTYRRVPWVVLVGMPAVCFLAGLTLWWLT